MSLILESFEDVVKALELKQAEIFELKNQLIDMEEENQRKVKEFAKPLQDKQDSLFADIKKKTEVYKAETKKYFGIADGEPADILQLMKVIKRVSTSA